MPALRSFLARLTFLWVSLVAAGAFLLSFGSEALLLSILSLTAVLQAHGAVENFKLNPSFRHIINANKRKVFAAVIAVDAIVALEFVFLAFRNIFAISVLMLIAITLCLVTIFGILIRKVSDATRGISSMRPVTSVVEQMDISTPFFVVSPARQFSITVSLIFSTSVSFGVFLGFANLLYSLGAFLIAFFPMLFISHYWFRLKMPRLEFYESALIEKIGKDTRRSIMYEQIRTVMVGPNHSIKLYGENDQLIATIAQNPNGGKNANERLLEWLNSKLAKGKGESIEPC